jgi:hypothetical protein
MRQLRISSRLRCAGLVLGPIAVVSPWIGVVYPSFSDAAVFYLAGGRHIRHFLDLRADLVDRTSQARMAPLLLKQSPGGP